MTEDLEALAARFEAGPTEDDWNAAFLVRYPDLDDGGRKLKRMGFEYCLRTPPWLEFDSSFTLFPPSKIEVTYAESSLRFLVTAVGPRCDGAKGSAPTLDAALAAAAMRAWKQERET